MLRLNQALSLLNKSKNKYCCCASKEEKWQLGKIHMSGNGYTMDGALF